MRYLPQYKGGHTPPEMCYFMGRGDGTVASRGENELTDSSNGRTNSSLDIFSAPIHSHHIPCIVRTFTYLCTDCLNHYKREGGQKAMISFRTIATMAKWDCQTIAATTEGGGEQWALGLKAAVPARTRLAGPQNDNKDWFDFW